MNDSIAYFNFSTCHASNEAGEDQKYITVVVQQKRGDVGKLNLLPIVFLSQFSKIFPL